MASLNFFVPPIATTTQRRAVYSRATAAKGSGGSNEEKSILDFILGALQKEDQLLEIDPILKKVEGKSGTTSVSSSKKSVSTPPPKKNSNGFGGFGGLFAKKE